MQRKGMATNLSRNSDQDHPFLIRVDAVVDDLTAGHTSMSVKDLNGSRLSFHGPMINSSLSHQTEGLNVNPVPKDDIFMHQVGLKLGLHFQVEDLQLTLS
jgi:hypothetical protein